MELIAGDVSSLFLRDSVYQSNLLIEARKAFDSLEMKIFILGLGGLNPHFSSRDKFFDEEFKENFIPAATLLELFGNTKYLHEINAVCKKLFNASIYVASRSGGERLSNLFRRLEYVAGKGLYIQFSDVLRPHILDLVSARRYTRLNPRELFKLSSPYAIRLLELLLQYRNIKEFRLRQEIIREIKIDDLRFMLNVPDGAYRGRMNNFRRFVLDVAIREINERTSYLMSYKPIKFGRNVVSFVFELDTRRERLSPSDVGNPQLDNDAIEALRTLGFSRKAAREIFLKCIDAADCFSRINRAQALMSRSKKTIVNPPGFLRRSIENDWRLPGDNRKRKEASNFKSPNEIFKPVIKTLKAKAAAEEPPEPPSPFENNKYKIPAELVGQLIDWLANDRGEEETARLVLEMHNLTIEQFKEAFAEYFP